MSKVLTTESIFEIVGKCELAKKINTCITDYIFRSPKFGLFRFLNDEITRLMDEDKNLPNDSF